MQQIPLSQGKIAILDDEDFTRVGNVHWCYRADRDGKLGYATRHAKVDGKTLPPGVDCNHVRVWPGRDDGAPV